MSDERCVLPDGTMASSEEEYVEGWREFARPICEAMQCDLFAFDPGITVVARGITGRDRLLDLPHWFVQRMNERLREVAACTSPE
jgi:hypothetical protein